MSAPWLKYQQQQASADTVPAKGGKPWEKYAQPEPAPSGDFRTGAGPQIAIGVTEGLASLPGLPVDAIVGGGNFIRRQFDIPETKLEDTPLKDWGGQGFRDANLARLDALTGQTHDIPNPQGGVATFARKTGNFVGGALPMGPSAMIPAVTAAIGSEGGKKLDEAYPETTKGYGEFAGGVVGGFGPAAGRRMLVPGTTPERAMIAEHLMAEDVPVYPGQLATNPMTRNAYDLADKLSIYDNGAQARQADAVTRVLSRTMGENDTNLVQASHNAHERLSGVPDPANPVGPKLAQGEYDRIYARIGDHPIGHQAVIEIGTLAQRAQQLTGRSQDIVMNAINNVASAVRNGRISIRGFKDLTDQGGALSELAGNANPTLSLYGTQLRQILENNIRRQATPADARALEVADSQWRHMKTLEGPIARSASPEGQISPALIRNAVATASGRTNARGASGMPVLDAVGDAGQSFLKPPRSSGTSERSAIIGLLTGGAGTGGFIAGGPVGAALSIGGAVAAPLATRFLLQRQWLTRMMIDDARRRGANPAMIRMLTRGAATLPGNVQQQALPAPRRMLTGAAAVAPGSIRRSP